MAVDRIGVHRALPGTDLQIASRSGDTRKRGGMRIAPAATSLGKLEVKIVHRAVLEVARFSAVEIADVEPQPR